MGDRPMVGFGRSPVIIRLGSGHVSERNAGPIHEIIRERLPDVMRQDGIVACHVGRTTDATGESLVIITAWRDMAALYAWVEGDLGRLVILRDLEARIDRFKLQLF